MPQQTQQLQVSPHLQEPREAPEYSSPIQSATAWSKRGPGQQASTTCRQLRRKPDPEQAPIGLPGQTNVILANSSDMQH